MSESIPTKYFHADNTNRFIVAPGGRKFSFDSYKLGAGGVWLGVYRTNIEAEQADLAVMVANPKFGVKEITEAEYLAKLQKKSPLVKDLKPLEPVKPQEPPAKVAAVAAKVFASEQAAKEKPSEVPEAEVVNTAPVSPRRRRGVSAIAEEKPQATETPTPAE